jgi:hypothetical protein
LTTVTTWVICTQKSHACDGEEPMKAITRAAAVFLLLQMGVTNAYSQGNTACATEAPLRCGVPMCGATSCGVTNKGSSTFALSVCQGENQHRISNFNPTKDTRSFTHFCDQHPYTTYATCNATVDWIAANQCRNQSSPYYTIQDNYPKITDDGNRCGYRWFTITCWSGE